VKPLHVTADDVWRTVFGLCVALGSLWIISLIIEWSE
jgi:hypothetical protein